MVHTPAETMQEGPMSYSYDPKDMHWEVESAHWVHAALIDNLMRVNP